jgi:hypothetical protein
MNERKPKSGQSSDMTDQLNLRIRLATRELLAHLAAEDMRTLSLEVEWLVTREIERRKGEPELSRR